MGGREVGGLANTLAAHMDFDAATPRPRRRASGARRAWRRAAGPEGRRPVRGGRRRAGSRRSGSWRPTRRSACPTPTAVREALAACPFVVVSDCMAETDTTRLRRTCCCPPPAWGEKDGTVTNSERRISPPARRCSPPPGEARADWWIIADVGRRMGFGDAFAWRTPAAGLPRARARSPPTRTTEPASSNLGPLAGLTADGYDALEPVQWPVTAAGGTARLFTDGRFQTPDGRARMVPVAAAGPAEALDAGLPAGAQHRPGARPLAHHDPHRPGARALPPRARALRRDPPRRRRSRWASPTGALTRVQTAPGRGRGRRPGHRPPAAGRGLHADALDRRLRAVRPRQPAGRRRRSTRAPASRSSSTRPARVRPYRETWRGFFLAREAWTPPAGLDLVWRRIPQAGCQLHEFAGRGDAARARRRCARR